VPNADPKPTLAARVEAKTPVPIPVPKADSKPTLAARVEAKTPVPIPVPKVELKPTPVPIPVPKIEIKPAAEVDAAVSMTREAIEEPAISLTQGAAAVSMSHAAVETPAAAKPAAIRPEGPEPGEAIMAPRPAPDTLDEPKKRPVWLMAVGLVLLVGLPAAWLATRDDPTTTAAAEGKPKGLEQPEVTPTPPKPEPVQPEPVDDGGVVSGGTPVPDPVADPDGGTPAADGGGTLVPPDPQPKAVADPEPDAPSGDGGSRPSTPTPQEKARELIRAGDKAYAAGQLPKAESKYKAALVENPRAHAAAAGLGRIAFNKAAYAEAANHYGRAVKAAGSNSGYRILYGDALFKLGKYADAKVQYSKAKSLGNAQADGRLKKVESKL
jgi:hypothetical protein